MTSPTLLLFLLSLSCVVQGQKKDTTRPVKDTVKIVLYDMDSTGYLYKKTSLVGAIGDSIFILQGDSLSAIKLLWKELELSRKREKDLQDRLYRINEMLDRIKKTNEKALKKELSLE